MENGKNLFPPSALFAAPSSLWPNSVNSNPSESSSTSFNAHQSDEYSGLSFAAWRRNYSRQNPSPDYSSQEERREDPGDDDDSEKIHGGVSPSSFLLPVSSKDRFPSGHDKRNGITSNKMTRTVISIRILVIVILISLFSWFYLEALAGGDIEWVKNHLSILGTNLILSVLCLTTALTMIVLTPMTRAFTICLCSGVGVILYALKRWDDGESFEAHGAYNMLVFLVIAVPLNGLIQSILFCQRKMPPRKFRRFMTLSVMGTTLLTTLLLTYYHSIWGMGANGAHLLHGKLNGTQLCEWQGINIPAVDLLPNHIQNFWTGKLYCPVVTGIEAEWTHEGLLTINCLNKEFKVSGASPTYDILPDTKPWPASDKIMHTYNKKIVERTQRHTYNEPVFVNDKGVEAIVANCETDVSKVLIRLVRDQVVLDRVRTAEKTGQGQEEATISEQEQEHEFTGALKDDGMKDDKELERRPNVLVLFLDAVSRRNFYRKMAKTASVIASLDKTTQGGPQLHEFFRYHAVGFNTDANSRVVYTNYPEPQSPPAPPIWKDFHEAGYITSRVEDNCEDWSTQYTGVETSKYFDHELQAPFCLPPYYALEGNPFSNFEGPYSIVSRCLHGTNVHNHALEYMNQFRRAYPDQPWFQMGSFIEGHEGTGEVLLTLDGDMARFFKGMEKDGTLDNTIIFMMADHGLHMGINFMFTTNGRIEHMNPYLSVILPPSITQKYPSLAKGLMHNQQSLITGYEIHATLKMLASGKMPKHGDEDGVDGGNWRKGTLFDEELDPGRTCEQARVPEEYCSCRAN
ncbi:hypothetical protein BCR41DRAFT_389926 [Lobosporangium transversale]|uniref:Alkaline-phosphatase-like protein n=1 Tax=Lobosporangium transversale TaxID=64571 RepID=A0A1Y2GAF7_9FUNG|nr:hypothetical protein BCR41DRAFT_389926 [Lobosporangium transversale]ORZ04570.1 hypothetical protein BCR41DRAFT_389926 [Lobosporangium transversale]|eukprot:XP_021876616.1 hypothetical protein BCR41DRAFT_389926 [Lobosporangium transversale]